MQDLISRQAAIDAVEESRRLNHHHDGKEACAHEYEHRHFLKILRDLPSAQPERESGEWIIADTQNEEDEQNGNYRYICSCCGYSDIHSKAVRVPYCWHCGADMRGEEDG